MTAAPRSPGSSSRRSTCGSAAWSRSRTSPRPACRPGSSTIDFGPEIGVRRSSAQITNYERAELEGTLVVAVVNFPPKRIGPFISEVLVLGALDDELGVVLLRPDREAALGDRIA